MAERKKITMQKWKFYGKFCNDECMCIEHSYIVERGALMRSAEVWLRFPMLALVASDVGLIFA